MIAGHHKLLKRVARCTIGITHKTSFNFCSRHQLVDFCSMVKDSNHHQRHHVSRHRSNHSSDSLNTPALKSTSSLKSLKSSSIQAQHSLPSSGSQTTKMKVYPIRALQDNYMYLLVDEPTKQAAAVDPVNASAMANAVSEYGAELKCILTTHHHYDHAHGNGDMVSMFPDLVVYGGDQRVQAITKAVEHGEIIRLGTLTIECLSTPCHTRGHICYYVHNEELSSNSIQPIAATTNSSTKSDMQQNNNHHAEFPSSPPPPSAASSQMSSHGSVPVERVVFTGDTLFIAGCGRFFEGTSEQMDHNLNIILGGLPPDTRVYCGHEYTVNNLKFALSVEPQNTDIKAKLDWAQSKVAKREPTVPSTIGEEKRINPFMRLNKSHVKRFAKEQNDLEVMSVLRQKKNEFTA